jgi:large subunit ribosomal protein L21e
MVKRAGSFRSGTRKKLRKAPRSRGKVSVTRQLQQFSIGERVIIKQEPAVHNGMPHPKYKNKLGTVMGRRGSSYEVQVHDGGKAKIMIAAPVHLVKMGVA